MAITYLSFNFPGVPGVHCAFQTRVGGFSHGAYGAGNVSFHTADKPASIAKNKAALAASLGLSRMAEVFQVHGKSTIFEPQALTHTEKPTIEADGLASSEKGLGLLVKSADCQPILLCHRSGQYIAALHVGWRGNLIHYPTIGVQDFCTTYGLQRTDVFAVRGPSLSPQAAEFVNFDKEWSEEFRPWFNSNEQTMDLWALTRHQLQEAGIPANQIYGLDLCTYYNHDLFFSYRRNPASGRQASVIWMEDSAEDATD